MTEPLRLDLSQMLLGSGLAAVLVFMRVGAIMALLPAFGEQSVPLRFRLMLALAFTAIVAPALAGPPPAGAAILPPILIEAAIGLALGAALRLLVLALQIAGAVIAQATTLSQLFAGGAEPQPAVGHLLVISGLALAVAGDFHLLIVRFILLSYQLLPAGQLPSAADMAQWGVAHIGQAFGLGVALAAPFTIAALLYNLVLGAINRALPALMVSMIGAPALGLAGLALLAVAGPWALSVWMQALRGFVSQPFQVPP